MTYIRQADGIHITTWGTLARLEGAANLAPMISQYTPPFFDVQVTAYNSTPGGDPSNYFSFFGWWWDWQSRMNFRVWSIPNDPGILNLDLVVYSYVGGEVVLNSIEFAYTVTPIDLRIMAHVAPIGPPGTIENFVRRWVFAYRIGGDWTFFQSCFEDWSGSLPFGVGEPESAIYSEKLKGYSYSSGGDTYANHFTPRIGLGVSPGSVTPQDPAEVIFSTFLNVDTATEPIIDLPEQIITVA